SGLTVEGRSPDNSQPGVSTAVTACSSPQRAGVVRFTEGFGTAFKIRTATPFVDADTSPTPAPQNFPGTIYNSESGFYSPGLTSPNADFSTVGLASFGTRLQANIAVPSGTRVWVSLRNVTYSGGNPVGGTSARMLARGLRFSPAAATAILEGV